MRVNTRRGWVVLASDGSHYYEHFENNRCFPTVFNVGEMVDGYDILKGLADSIKHIIPRRTSQDRVSRREITGVWMCS